MALLTGAPNKVRDRSACVRVKAEGTHRRCPGAPWGPSKTNVGDYIKNYKETRRETPEHICNTQFQFVVHYLVISRSNHLVGAHQTRRADGNFLPSAKNTHAARY